MNVSRFGRTCGEWVNHDFEIHRRVFNRLSGMMAEGFHSLADTTNQVFLLLGLRFYKKPASEKHPFGYGKERFF